MQFKCANNCMQFKCVNNCMQFKCANKCMQFKCANKCMQFKCANKCMQLTLCANSIGVHIWPFRCLSLVECIVVSSADRKTKLILWGQSKCMQFKCVTNACSLNVLKCANSIAVHIWPFRCLTLVECIVVSNVSSADRKTKLTLMLTEH